MTDVVFVAGALQELRGHLEELGLRRALVVTTGGRSAASVSPADLLGDRFAGIYDKAREHVPVATVAAALDAFRAVRADVCIAIGGGSAIGLGKAIARNTGTPLVAVPTTYSGSEMTSIWGETDETGKRTGRDPAAKPALVIYDPLLTLGLPPDASAASGMNAMAHAVEAMYAANATEEARTMAARAAMMLHDGLPKVVADGRDLQTRLLVLYGAHLAGQVLEDTAMGLHHRICHVLGGTFRLPHARTHACVLPHVVAFNAPLAVDAMTRLGEALGNPDVAASLAALNRRLGLRDTLGTLGLRAGDLDRAAEEVTKTPYANPRLASAGEIRHLLLRAL